jgi:hypothetical protein
MRVPIKKLNWRQILIHFLAIWLIMYSLKHSSYFIDMRIFKMIIPGNKPDLLQALKENTVSWDEVKTYISLTSSFWFYGLLLGFLISLIISIKRRWYWVNTIISSCGVYLIYRMPEVFFNYRMSFDKKYSAGWHTTIYPNYITPSIFWYTTVAVFCLAAALFLFFSKRVNKFIAKTI